MVASSSITIHPYLYLQAGQFKGGFQMAHRLDLQNLSEKKATR